MKYKISTVEGRDTHILAVYQTSPKRPMGTFSEIQEMSRHSIIINIIIITIFSNLLH